MSRLESHLGKHIPWTQDRAHFVPDHFGNPLAETQSLKNAVALLDFSHHEIIAITGEERVSFLGGLVTNQVNKVTKHHSVYSAHLTPQGRFLWDFTMIFDDNRLLLITEPGDAKPLVQRLSMYILRAKIQIQPIDAFALLGLVGPDTIHRLNAFFPTLSLTDSTPPGATFVPESGIRLWRDPRHVNFGWRLLIPVESLPAWWDRLAQTFMPVGFSAWEEYRIRQGLPRSGNEFISEVSLPLESGLLEMHGVDFTKGCYVGQETTARTHHRGTLKKRVFCLMLSEGSEVKPGTPILLPNGKEIGVITSVTSGTSQRAGLGILHLLADVSEESQLIIGTLPVTARKPDWASWQ